MPKLGKKRHVRALLRVEMDSLHSYLCTCRVYGGTAWRHFSWTFHQLVSLCPALVSFLRCLVSLRIFLGILLRCLEMSLALQGQTLRQMAHAVALEGQKLRKVAQALALQGQRLCKTAHSLALEGQKRNQMAHSRNFLAQSRIFGASKRIQAVSFHAVMVWRPNFIGRDRLDNGYLRTDCWED